MSILAEYTWSQLGLLILLISVSLFLMLVILLQRGRGGGLSGAFGGGGGGTAAFGAKTGDVFTLITVVVAVAFLLLSIFANYAFDESSLRTTAALPAATTTVPIDTGAGEAVPAEGTVPVAPAPAGGGAPDGGAAPATTGDAAPEPAPAPAGG